MHPALTASQNAAEAEQQLQDFTHTSKLTFTCTHTKATTAAAAPEAASLAQIA